MAPTRKPGTPPPEARFDVWFRRVLRISALVGFFALLTIFLLGRPVPAEWLFLIGGMLGIDGLAGALSARK